MLFWCFTEEKMIPKSGCMKLSTRTCNKQFGSTPTSFAQELRCQKDSESEAEAEVILIHILTWPLKRKRKRPETWQQLTPTLAPGNLRRMLKLIWNRRTTFNCCRVYDDDLFPGICKYLSKCRANPSLCELSSQEDVNITAPPPVAKKVFNEPFPFKAVGAGRSRGLSIIMDSLRWY